MHIILCAKAQNFKEVKKCFGVEVLDGYTMQQECQDG